ncbi:succinate dehydrogenase cytochrome b subunit [Antarcticibacterium sp. 1MA-6-2]|uniref:succinate dehydrogenase cytochrome b subunit n=1 Tax=Antarcticibacterium sp. 1MA-6-2 TaxID=2908210 RepID=UPI001F294D96|nr:succinate dehydrogenase cytochrome b subunit [Antarcticibacterium sp. 1MA-6-2]UJH89979.1 succinate dehydrogenase cytochrome b subunit [Antarcticibacterium sp. 1MA-6-2]
MAKSALLKSSLAKKYWMAFTGLFLCTFLVGHLLGNLQLLLPVSEATRDQFNEYGLFMTTNPLIMILSYVTYLSILFHAIDGVILTINNNKARPKGYVRYKPSANSTWSSRNMGLLGTVIFAFIVLHMNALWAKMKFGGLDHTIYETASGAEVKDLYTLTIETFQDPDYGLLFVIIYVISMAAIAFHLKHGFASGFQSLGVNHPNYNGFIRKFGYAFSILVPLAFAVIPVYIYFVLDKI